MSRKKTIPLTINLAPKDPFFKTILGKTLKWALSVGRYIVIFTELIVIMSFAARFSLDRQVTNLNDKLHQQEQIILSFGDLEQNVRLAQYKVDQYRQIEQQTNLSEVFPALSAITPPGVVLDELIIKPTSVAASGIARNQTALNLFISNLQLSPRFHDVSVDMIEAGDKRNPGFKFRVRAATAEEILETPAVKPPAPKTPTKPAN